MTAQDVGRAIHGFRNMSSDHEAVRDVLDELALKVAGCSVALRPHDIEYALSGMQRMSADRPHVRAMVGALLPKIRACRGTFQARSIANAIYGLQRMSTEWPAVRELVMALSGHVKACQSSLNSHDASIALHGLQGMSGNVTEVQELLNAILGKISTDRDAGHWEVQDVSLAFLGLFDVDVGSEWHVLLQEWLLTLATASPDDARTAYQTLALVLGMPCSLRRTLESFTTREKLLLLQEELKKRCSEVQLVPRTLRRQAEMYKTQAEVAFADEEQVGVTTAEVLFGFECDIVLRQDLRVVNVQLQEDDHPPAGRCRFSYLRDKLLQQNGVRVVRVQTQGRTRKEALEFFQTL